MSVLCGALIACGGTGDVPHDSAGGADGRGNDSADFDGPPGVYAHTIHLDGVDDFTSAEAFATTSGSYAARIAWDADSVYLGYSGDDLSTATADGGTKWLFMYVDSAAGGSTTSQQYNTQVATFPAGFAAELYLRWKADGTFTSIEQYDEASGTWSTAAGSAPPYAQKDTYLEIALPRALLGGAEQVGVVTYMLNEKDGAEGTYAGLYEDNFVDGYGMNLQLAHYLSVDFTGTAQPNDPANERP